MKIGGMGTAEWIGYTGGKTRRGAEQKGMTFPDEMAARTAEAAKEYNKAREEPKGGKAESETDSQIIVKPDGSRILITTVNIGGMKMITSLKISEPTDMVNTVGAKEAAVSEEDGNGCLNGYDALPEDI